MMCPRGHIFCKGKTMKLKRETTFEEQLELLRKKGIIINTPKDCIKFLQQVNYYRFSAYYLPFRDADSQILFKNVEFERIKKIYEFDQAIRRLIFSAIEDIEIYLRTQIVYYHVHKYGSEGYRNPNCYNERHNHSDFSHRLSVCINENRKTLVVQHHMCKYDGHFPFWVIIEFFSMGMLSHFYRDLTTQDRKQVAKDLYNTNYKNLESWMRCITDLRNRCAHYSRVYYWIFPAIPKMPTEEKYIPTRRLFAQLYMLKLMHPNKEKWNNEFLNPLTKLVKKYKADISLKHLDFPYCWKSLLKQ